MPPIRTKGPPVGPCNICDQVGKLTWDHVPPKGTTPVTQVVMNHMVYVLGQQDGVPRGLRSPNGMKYRTICETCNNGLLGGWYDPELAHLSNQIIGFLSSTTHLLSHINVSMDPQYVTKAAVGHILALGVGRQQKGDLGTQLAAYVLDPAAPLPAGADVHFWPYPFRRQSVIRDAGLIRGLGRDHVVFFLLKFLPLAFMLTFDESTVNPIRAPLLTPYVRRPWRGRIEVPIQMVQLPGADFPEAPAKDGVVMYGDGAIAAVPRKRHRDAR